MTREQLIEAIIQEKMFRRSREAVQDKLGFWDHPEAGTWDQTDLLATKRDGRNKWAVGRIQKGHEARVAVRDAKHAHSQTRGFKSKMTGAGLSRRNIKKAYKAHTRPWVRKFKKSTLSGASRYHRERKAHLDALKRDAR